MSRFDEIKARCDAATQGPWSFDWSEGEVPVFYGQTTKISGTFSVEANTIEDAEFIAAAREDVPWLIECIGELNGAICWDTTCLNCASLLDSNYDQYMRAEIAEAEFARLTAEREWFGRWKAEALEMIDNALAEVARLTTERDALAAAHARESEKVWKVEEVMDDIEGSDPTTWERLRDALAGSEADTTDVDVCSGDADCTSALHVHGCFADEAGPCTNPDEHQSTDQEVK